MNDFVVLCVDFLVSIISTIFFWRFLLADYDSLGGWSLAGLVLIGIFGNASWAVGELFAGSWGLSDKIIEGKFDKYMCRPVNALLATVLEDMQVEEMIKGMLSLVILLVWHKIRFHIQVIAVDLLFALVSFALGIVIVAVVRSIYSCCAFWFENTSGFHYLIHMEDLEFDRYPLNIFNKATRIVLISIIPVGFVSYFPAMFYMHMINYRMYYILFETVILAMLMLLLHFIWKRGVKRYEATGG